MIWQVIRAALAVIVLALPARAEVPIVSVTSPGGITAWLVESHDIPFTALEIRFRGGASLDTPGKRGAINLMTALIEEGAGDMDAQGFAAARDALAASYSFRTYDDVLAISAKFLSENRDDAVDLLHLALTQTRFDTDAIERVRGQVFANIRADAQDPQTIATRTLDRLAFGDHPYATALDGTMDSVAALTRDDLIAARARVMVRDRLVVSAVGDITPEDLGALLDRLLGDLPQTGAEEPGDAPFLLEGGVTVVPYDTPQSEIIFGQKGLKQDDPDFFAAYVLNEILGGGRFTSRLMTEVREKRGLTYGIGTYLVALDHAELVMGGAATQNARAAETIAVIREQWGRIAAEGVSADELDAAKTYLTGSYPLRFDGNGPIANILVGMQLQGYPIDYAKTRNARIEEVTGDDIARVAKRLLAPDALHFVVVGQPEGL
ncbi:MAG: pitrilysin family protein [Paracoccaceae bacterium]